LFALSLVAIAFGSGFAKRPQQKEFMRMMGGRSPRW
jgi:hypothetical protein